MNTTLRRCDRIGFQVLTNDWQEFGEKPLRQWLEALLRDLGTGLDTSLYEEALTHLLGGEEEGMQEIEVMSGATQLGLQKFRRVAPDVVFKITAFANPTDLFAGHARKLLEHTKLQAIQWINVARNEVLFQTIRQ